jgi:hypothetical protein
MAPNFKCFVDYLYTRVYRLLGINYDLFYVVFGRNIHLHTYIVCRHFYHLPGLFFCRRWAQVDSYFVKDFLLILQSIKISNMGIPM